MLLLRIILGPLLPWRYTWPGPWPGHRESSPRG
jgi:hypothetical protein